MLFADEPTNQLDTLEGLTTFLNRETTPVGMPSLGEYRLMAPSQRTEFNSQRLDHLGSDLVIATPQVAAITKKVFRAVLGNRNKSVGRFGVMISGRSTMGKTTAAMSAMQAVHNQYTAQFPDHRHSGRIPVVYVEVPPGSTGKAMIGRFANFLGIPVRKGSTLEDLMRIVVPQLNHAGTKLIVVDELHNLSKNNHGNGESVDVLKSLSDQVPAAFVYAGINIHQGGLLAGERGQQIAGRFTLQHLQPYTLANAEEKALWNGIIVAFESQLCLLGHKPHDLLAHSGWLHDRTQGSIGSLGRLLTSAAQALIFQELDPSAERLTREVLDDTPLDISAETNAAALAPASVKKAPRTQSSKAQSRRNDAVAS